MNCLKRHYAKACSLCDRIFMLLLLMIHLSCKCSDYKDSGGSQNICTHCLEQFFKGGGDDSVVGVLAEFLEGDAGAGMIEVAKG